MYTEAAGSIVAAPIAAVEPTELEPIAVTALTATEVAIGAIPSYAPAIIVMAVVTVTAAIEVSILEAVSILVPASILIPVPTAIIIGPTVIVMVTIIGLLPTCFTIIPTVALYITTVTGRVPITISLGRGLATKVIAALRNAIGSGAVKRSVRHTVTIVEAQINAPYLID